MSSAASGRNSPPPCRAIVREWEVLSCVTAMNPASVLQWHPKVTVCLDEAAASEQSPKDYYRWAYEHKPAWQNI